MTLPAFPSENATLLLPGPAGALEVAVEHPDPGGPQRPLLAVICHPLPTGGGTMHNKVVTMLARSLRELGAVVVRFNFRGVGQSQGGFDNGGGEREDLRTVFEWARTQHPEYAIWLAGFSFGAYVSLAIHAQLRPDLLISVAPPAGRWDFAAIPAPTMPWVVVQGEDDEIVDPEAVYAWLNRLGAHTDLIRMPGTGHFFHRKMMDLRGAIRHSVRDYLPAGTDHANDD